MTVNAVIVAELVVMASDPTNYLDLTRYSFQTRRQLVAAAVDINPADPMKAIDYQRSTVVTRAQTREAAGIR